MLLNVPPLFLLSFCIGIFLTWMLEPVCKKKEGEGETVSSCLCNRLNTEILRKHTLRLFWRKWDFPEMHITAKGEMVFCSMEKAICKSNSLCFWSAFYFMVNCLNMGFCFIYKPRNFYVDNALLRTKQTEKHVSSPKINSGKKKKFSV